MKVKVCPNSGCMVWSFCDRFCRKCGAVLVKAPSRPADNFPCPTCKASVFSHDRFCGTCGQDMSLCIFAFVFENGKVTIDSEVVFAANLAKAWEALSLKTRFKVESLYHMFGFPKIIFLGFLKDAKIA